MKQASDLRFRPASESDKDWVRELHTACYRPVVIEQFGEWDNEVQAGFFAAKWRDLAFEILEAGGGRVGACICSEDLNCVMIHEILIVPEHQGRGFGTAVVKRALELAARTNRPARLKVLLSNRAAELYRRLGFVQTGTDETHRHMEWRRGSADCEASSSA